jgi:hypothetical protein
MGGELKHKYLFNLPWAARVAGVLFYCALAAWTAHLADDYVGFLRVFLLGASGLLTAFGSILFFRRLLFPRSLELTEDAILYPKGFLRTQITALRCDKIVRIGLSEERFNEVLYLGSSQGPFEIPASYFANIEAYEAVRDFIFRKAAISVPVSSKASTARRAYAEYPAPLLHWREPDDWPSYRTNLFRSVPLSIRIGRAVWFFARCTGLLVLPWLALRVLQVPTQSAVAYLSSAGLVSLFFTLVYWAERRRPVHVTKISLRKNGITQHFGKQVLDHSYSDLSGWNIIERQFHERVLHILLVQRKRWRKPSAIALAGGETRDALSRILSEKSVPDARLRAPWETGEL